MSQHGAKDDVKIDLSELPTQADIPLRDLSISEFNPRRRYDPETIKEFANSIKKDGLIQNLVVRPDGDGGFEVVAGSRRFKALQHLHGEGSTETARCNVHDYDDETAKRITLVENLQKEDLTTIEEAWGFAQLITVDYRDDEHGVSIEETYSEYINAVSGDDVAVQNPSSSRSSVETVAEEVGLNPSSIADTRLTLLTLPEDVQEMVVDGSLVSKAGRRIGSLRNIPDAEFRQEAMRHLAEKYAGNFKERSGADADLRHDVQRIIEDYENLEERAGERTEEYADLLDERAEKLTETIQQACEEYNGLDAIDADTLCPDFPNHDPEARVETAQEIADAGDTVREEVDRAINEIEKTQGGDLDDRRDDIRQDMQHLQRNVRTMQSEDRERCPFCLQDVDIDHLRDQIDAFRDELESIEERQSQLNEIRDELRSSRRAVSDAVSDVRSGVSRYQKELDRESPDPMDILPGGGSSSSSGSGV